MNQLKPLLGALVLSCGTEPIDTGICEGDTGQEICEAETRTPMPDTPMELGKWSGKVEDALNEQLKDFDECRGAQLLVLDPQILGSCESAQPAQELWVTNTMPSIECWQWDIYKPDGSAHSAPPECSLVFFVEYAADCQRLFIGTASCDNSEHGTSFSGELERGVRAVMRP